MATLVTAAQAHHRDVSALLWTQASTSTATMLATPNQATRRWLDSNGGVQATIA